ncbi:MAG: catalase [Herbaspirillum sp.]|nr:catalase [Herbaspirillum sp.]
MASKKSTNAGAGSVLGTMSGAAEIGTTAGKKTISPDLLKKVGGTAALAASMRRNKNKRDEIITERSDPAIASAGLTAKPATPQVTASSITETVASPKTGGGKPTLGRNAVGGELDRVRVDSGAQALTTNQGVPIADNQNSLKAGVRGPTALEDFILREKITHFDHERIPERVVHARGSAAHGYFESYHDLSEITRAAPFAGVGKRTPVFARFSTVAGGAASADTVRDVRGFAVKFYTDEGNWDLVGNNIPVFFIQDAMKFPDLVHALKPEPHFGMPQASSAHDTFWDFVSLMPESTHMLLWQMSDRAIPRSYRMMQGFGVHTFRLVNAEGESVFCKFHWTPVAGTHSLVWDEAVKIAGADPDFHRRDLWEAIESGHAPEWELGLQLFTEEEAEGFEFDVLDPTKIVPEELAPLRPIGRMVLDRNPDNFFAETEQVAFCTAHIVPGIDFSNDPLLQGRIHSYLDTQISRLGGVNFHELPINAPLAPVHNNQRDGMHRQALHRGRVSYEPNSLGGGCPFQAGAAGFISFPQALEGNKLRAKPEKFADHYSQARLFWNSQSSAEQRHIIKAFRFELTRVQTPAIRKRVVSLLVNVNDALAASVANGLGFKTPKRAPIIGSGAMPEYQPSPALSLMSYPGASGITTRKVAILVADGIDTAVLGKIYDVLLGHGAAPRVVAPKLGAVKGSDNVTWQADITLDAAPSALYDAVIVPSGVIAAATLCENGLAIEFIKDQYRHCKPILVFDSGADLLERAELSPVLPTGDPDFSLINSAADQLNEALAQFMQALAGPRELGRETEPPVV